MLYPTGGFAWQYFTSVFHSGDVPLEAQCYFTLFSMHA